MLVITRRRGDSVMVGEDVEITVVDIRGNQIRLGINAPKETPVHRREVYEAIQKEKNAQSNTKD